MCFRSCSKIKDFLIFGHMLIWDAHFLLHSTCAIHAISTTHFGLAHSGSQPFNFACSYELPTVHSVYRVSGSSCAAITNRPLRVSEIFEVEITDALKHPHGSLSVGVISQRLVAVCRHSHCPMAGHNVLDDYIIMPPRRPSIKIK